MAKGKGKSILGRCWDKGIGKASYYRWKKQYSGIQAGRLKELEKENNRLKKLLAEVMLDHFQFIEGGLISRKYGTFFKRSESWPSFVDLCSKDCRQS